MFECSLFLSLTRWWKSWKFWAYLRHTYWTMHLKLASSLRNFPTKHMSAGNPKMVKKWVLIFWATFITDSTDYSNLSLNKTDLTSGHYSDKLCDRIHSLSHHYHHRQMTDRPFVQSYSKPQTTYWPVEIWWVYKTAQNNGLLTVILEVTINPLFIVSSPRISEITWCYRGGEGRPRWSSRWWSWSWTTRLPQI